MGQLLTSQGTVYPLLGRLSEEGLVASSWQVVAGGRPRRYYELTAAGAAHLRTFATDWARFSRNVDDLLLRSAAQSSDGAPALRDVR